MLRNFEKARETLEKLAIDRSANINRDNASLIKSDEFWFKVAEIKALLEPIANGILKIEKNNSVVSDVIVVFNEISKNISHFVETKLLSQIEITLLMEKFIQRQELIVTPAHCFANLIDPRYRGKSLDDDQIFSAKEYFESYLKRIGVYDNEEIRNEIYASYNEFKGSKGYFSLGHLWIGIDSPFEWWQSIGNEYKKHKELTKIAVRFISIPGSNAAVERNFKTQADIHTSDRNRLKHEKVEKLVAIKNNLHLLDGNQSDVQMSFEIVNETENIEEINYVIIIND